MMSGSAEYVFSALICIVGLSIAGGYFLIRRSPAMSGAAWWSRLDTPAGVQARRRRRSQGMTIVAVVSLATFAGINYLDPGRSPAQYGAFWLVVLGLLLWLLVLALADVRHTVKLLQLWQRRRLQSSTDQFPNGGRQSPTALRRDGEQRGDVA